MVERDIDAYVFRQLRSCGHRSRVRLVRERLSNTPLNRNDRAGFARRRAEKAPLARVSGRLARDAQYFVVRTATGHELTSLIGRRAYYAEIHEASGRLRFREIMRQEMERTRDDIRIGLPIVLRRNRPSSAPIIAAPVRELPPEAALQRAHRSLSRLERRAALNEFIATEFGDF